MNSVSISQTFSHAIQDVS